MFKRKNRVKKSEDEKLLQTFIAARDDWAGKKKLLEKSIDPDPSVVYQLKLAEARYFFLLKEAKARGLSLDPKQH